MTKLDKIATKMTGLAKIFTVPLSWLYGLGVVIRHQMFDWGILKSREFDIPIISIGNLTVGGTGKTPHAEFFVQLLSPYYNIAVISRGYKRKSKGFVLADMSMSSRVIGDEPKQIKHKFPHIPVAVCEKRVDGINALREIHPEVNLIILDDAFQHRYVEPWLSVLLMDYNNPIFSDHLLPHGRLRDVKSQMSRANFVFVTKCPDSVKPIDLRVMMKKLNLFPYQSLFFTKVASLRPVPIYPDYNQRPLAHKQSVIVMSGIANPKSFVASVKRDYNVVGVLSFGDHHIYKMKDIKRLEAMLADKGEDTMVIMTEKDSVKFSGSNKIPDNIARRLFYSPIKVKVIGLTAENNAEEILQKTIPYVSANQKYSMLHPE